MTRSRQQEPDEAPVTRKEFEALRAHIAADENQRLSERLMVWLRGRYPSANEAQIRAAHTLLMSSHGAPGLPAVRLASADEGGVKLREEDPRGEAVLNVLEEANKVVAPPWHGALRLPTVQDEDDYPERIERAARSLGWSLWRRWRAKRLAAKQQDVLRAFYLADDEWDEERWRGGGGA